MCSTGESTGTKTCADPQHKQMEAQNKEQSASTFILKEHFKKAQIAHPTEFFSQETEAGRTADLPELEEHQEWFDIEDSGQIIIQNEPDPGTIGVGDDLPSTPDNPCPSKAANGNRIVKAQFGRRRTHNKQTLVRPCGMIFARATMFGAKAVSNFLVRAQYLSWSIHVLTPWHLRL